MRSRKKVYKRSQKRVKGRSRKRVKGRSRGRSKGRSKGHRKPKHSIKSGGGNKLVALNGNKGGLDWDYHKTLYMGNHIKMDMDQETEFRESYGIEPFGLKRPKSGFFKGLLKIYYILREITQNYLIFHMSATYNYIDGPYSNEGSGKLLVKEVVSEDMTYNTYTNNPNPNEETYDYETLEEKKLSISKGLNGIDPTHLSHLGLYSIKIDNLNNFIRNGPENSFEIQKVSNNLILKIHPTNTHKLPHVPVLVIPLSFNQTEIRKNYVNGLLKHDNITPLLTIINTFWKYNDISSEYPFPPTEPEKSYMTNQGPLIINKGTVQLINAPKNRFQFHISSSKGWKTCKFLYTTGCMSVGRKKDGTDQHLLERNWGNNGHDPIMEKILPAGDYE